MCKVRVVVFGVVSCSWRTSPRVPPAPGPRQPRGASHFRREVLGGRVQPVWYPRSCTCWRGNGRATKIQVPAPGCRSSPIVQTVRWRADRLRMGACARGDRAAAQPLPVRGKRAVPGWCSASRLEVGGWWRSSRPRESAEAGPCWLPQKQQVRCRSCRTQVGLLR